MLQDKELLGRADCVCFVYDSSDPNSFAYVAGLMVRASRGARAVASPTFY